MRNRRIRIVPAPGVIVDACVSEDVQPETLHALGELGLAVSRLTPAQVEAMRERSIRRCRVCGCTAAIACPGGCWWVEADLCSSCDVVPHEHGGHE